MASNANRRAQQAAKRGGGFLSRIGNSRIGREVIAPAVASASLASQLNTDQALDRFASSKNTAASVAALQRAQPRSSNGLRGAKPNPLPPGMNVGSILAAQQQQDRAAASAEDTGELAGFAGDDSTFLESKTRSYSRPDVSESEAALEKQTEMRRNVKRLLVDGVAPEAREKGFAEAPRAERGAEEFEETPGERSIEISDELAEEEIAANFARQQQDDARMQEEQARATAAGAASQADALIKANKTARRVAKAAQAASAESVVTLITLGLQLNLETLNKWIFKIRIPYIIEVEKDPKPDANDVATGCFNCACCFGCLPQIIFLFVLGFALIWWVNTDPIGAVFMFIRDTFRGVFG